MNASNSDLFIHELFEVIDGVLAEIALALRHYAASR